MPESASGAVFDEQLDVAIIFLGRGVGAGAVVDEFAVFDVPVRLAGLGVHLDRRIGPFLDLGVAFSRGHGEQLAVVERVAAAPAGEILPVEQGGEAGRWIVQCQGRAGQAENGGQRGE
jgi:hypothetical protein